MGLGTGDGVGDGEVVADGVGEGLGDAEGATVAAGVGLGSAAGDSKTPEEDGTGEETSCTGIEVEHPDSVPDRTKDTNNIITKYFADFMKHSSLILLG
ncbi:MAG: hypothetical protein VB082_10505 [Christensenella sp.]|nr:hypothetical protein [Christensenella sp.]